MHSPRRRCRSEHYPFHGRRMIPPHGAVKLRQAQLHNTRDHLAPVLEFGEGLRVESDQKSPREIVVEKRQSSAPVKSPYQNDHTKNASHNSTTLSRTPRNIARDLSQDKINTQLSSIDAVISKAQDHDQRRQLGESEFYECTGDDSVVRRRSMLRTVDKDDFLIARGANPRTGLITPDWNSIASSVNNDVPRRPRTGRPSAQWKLDGDSWVSIAPEEQSEDALGEATTRSKRAHQATSSHLASGSESVAALTENNLRSFSNQTQYDTSLQKNLPSADEVTRESPIKRKPLRTPGPVHAANPLDPRPRRDASGGTVIHTPSVPDPSGTSGIGPFEYFSPDYVGRGLSRSDAATFPKRANNEIHFLGAMVKPRTPIDSFTTGFTNKITHLDLLQQSLRTNSGPYPPHLSSQQKTAKSRSQPFDLTQDMWESHNHPTRFVETCHNHRTQVQRVRRHHDVTSCQSAGRHIRPLNYSAPETLTGQDAPAAVKKPGIIFEEDLLPRNISKRLNIPQTPKSVNAIMNTSMRTTGQKTIEVIPSTPCFDQRSLRPNTDHHQDTSRRSNHQESSILMDVSHQFTESSNDTTLMSRPLLECRAQETHHMSNLGAYKTSMAPKVLSNMTGTRSILESRDQELQEHVDDPKSYQDGRSTTTDTNSPVSSMGEVSLTTKETFGDEAVQQDHSEFIDHSVCCPDCCIASDCHRGCLGHPTPDGSIVDNELSSPMSVGIFDANFETSVKAVNKALLTPMERPDGKIVRFWAAVGLKPSKGTGSRSPTRPNTMKRSLRNEPLSQKINASSKQKHEIATEHAKERNHAEAKKAAAKALSGGQISPTEVDHSRKVAFKTIDHIAKVSRAKISNKESKQHLSGANEGRRIVSGTRRSSRSSGPKFEGFKASLPENTVAELTDGDSIADEEVTSHTIVNDDADAADVLGKVGTFTHRGSINMKIKPAIFTKPALPNHIHSLATVLKDASMTIANTTSTIVTMVFEYNTRGKVVLPDGTNASDFGANLLRSILYFMVLVSVYALCLRTVEFVLSALRIVLLPVRVCMWVIE